MLAESNSTIPSEMEFQLFQVLIEEKLGIYLPEQKRALVGSRLWKRLNARRLTSFTDYYKLISTPAEKQELETALELITTNETYFFREPQHFDFLRDRVLPNIKDNASVRIWSAACSSGEELYSIAMLLSEELTGYWEIMGSDANKSMLSLASRGIYLDQRTDRIPPQLRKKYCRKGIREETGNLRMVPELRSKVKLMQILLHEPLPEIGEFDVVFLRNVMIYFDDVVRKKVVSQILERIKKGGYLFIGHSESLHGIKLPLAVVQPSIYMKSDAL